MLSPNYVTLDDDVLYDAFDDFDDAIVLSPSGDYIDTSSDEWRLAGEV